MGVGADAADASDKNASPVRGTSELLRHLIDSIISSSRSRASARMPLTHRLFRTFRREEVARWWRRRRLARALELLSVSIGFRGARALVPFHNRRSRKVEARRSRVSRLRLTLAFPSRPSGDFRRYINNNDIYGLSIIILSKHQYQFIR